MSSERFDVVVVGAGTAGISAAYHCARRGLKTALTDAKPFSDTGARWVNGIPMWLYDRAGIAQPARPELRTSANTRVHLFDKNWRRGLLLPRNANPASDMRALVRRLHALALKAGVQPFERTVVESVDLDGDRPSTLRVCVGDEETPRTLEAALFVDATGLGARLRKSVPVLDAICPAVTPANLCTAMQQVREIRDRDAATAFVKNRGAELGEILCVVGVEGGYSTLAVFVDVEHGEVEILTGSLADGRHKDGPTLLQEFLSGEPWIGEPIFGGRGIIPLRRPYDRFTVAGIACLGNSACHVFPAHGSGIGNGLVAGRQLAEAVAGKSDPGDAAALWGYQRAYMREFGAVSAAYDVFRLMSQRMTSDEIGAMLRAGLIQRAGSLAALEQRMPAVPPVELVRLAAGALREPRLALRFAPSIRTMNRAHAHYRDYPATYEPDSFRRWARRAAAFFGDQPDGA